MMQVSHNTYNMITGISTTAVEHGSRSQRQKDYDAQSDSFFGNNYIPELYPGMQMGIWDCKSIKGGLRDNGDVMESDPICIIYTIEGEEDPHTGGDLDLQKCHVYQLKRLWRYYKGWEFVEKFKDGQSIASGYCTATDEPSISQISRLKNTPVISCPQNICPKDIHKDYGFTSEIILKREFVNASNRRQKPLSIDDMADWMLEQISNAGGCLKLEVDCTDALYRTIYRELGQPRQINYLKRRS